MALEEKHVETRSWSTRYRGLVSIAASKTWQTADLRMSLEDDDFIWAWNRHGIRQLKELPLGSILCIGRLVTCIKTEYFNPDDPRFGEREAAFGNYAPGRYAWVFEDVLALPQPIPVKGSLGLYNLPYDTVEQLHEFLHDATASANTLAP